MYMNMFVCVNVLLVALFTQYHTPLTCTQLFILTMSTGNRVFMLHITTTISQFIRVLLSVYSVLLCFLSK